MLPLEIEQQINKWKRLNIEPHYIQVDGVYIVFKTLTKLEFQELVSDARHKEYSEVLGPFYTDQYRELIDCALLYPNPLPDDLPSLTDKLLAEAIIEASGWVSTDRLVQSFSEAREKALTLESFIRSRILAGFPTMKPSDLDNMRLNEMMDLAAMSEVITGVQIDMRPWLDPEGYNKWLEKQEKLARSMQREAELGIQTNPKMKNPEFRKKLIESARESRERLKDRRAEERINFNEMNQELREA